MATALSMAAKLGIDKSGYSQGVREAAKEAADLANTVEKSAKGASSGFSGLGASIRSGIGKTFEWLKDQAQDAGKVMLGVFGGNILTSAAQGVANAIRSVPTALMDMAKSALPIAGVGDAFQGITGDAKTMLQTLRTGSLGMVKDADLMKSYNSAAQLVGKEFADRLPSAMQYLSKVSAATGQDMGFMIDSMVKGVGRLSPMILDNLGIQVNATEANEAYAQSLGKNAAELTKTEQQTAMMNMVLEKLKENTAAMPAVAGTAAQSWAAMQTTFGNLKDTLGMKLAPALGDVAKSLSEAFNRPETQAMIANLAKALGELAKEAANVAALFLKGDIEAGLAKITDPATAKALVDIAEGFGKIHAGLVKIEEKNDWLSKLTPDEGGRRGLFDVAMEELQNAEKLGTGRKGLFDQIFGGAAEQTTAIQQTTAAISNYSMTTSSAALVQKTLANEAKYGADNVQSLAMNMDAARVAAEQFNTGAAANAAAVQSIAAAAQQSGQVMATAFSSEAVQSSMAAFQATVAQFQAQEELLNEQAGEKARQDFEARNAENLMAAAKYQQERAVIVAQGEAEIAALQAAGQAQKAAAKQTDLAADLAQSDAKRQMAVSQEQAKWDQQLDIQLRAEMVQRVQRLTAYNQQLQDQQDATLRALALAVQEASQKAGIEAAAQTAMLEMIYGAGSAALQAEYGFAQDRLSIEKDLAEGRMASAEAQIKAILAVQEAEKGNAASALEQAKAALAGFKIEAPQLPAIDTSQFTASVPAASAAAGAAGASASKPLAEKFTSALNTINDAIDSAQNALVKLLGFDLPEGWEAGLDRVKTFSRTLITVMEESAKQMTVKDAKTAEKISKAMDRTLGAFAKFAQVTDIFKTSSVTDADMAAWLDQYKRVVGFLLQAITELEAMYGGYENIKNLYKSAKRFKTLLDSVLIELSVVKVVELPDLETWKQQIISVVSTAVDTVTTIANLIGRTNLKKAAADASVIGTLVSVANSDLAGMKLGELPDLTTWKQQFVAVVRAVVEAMAEAEVTIGAIPITRAAELAPKIQTLTGAISGGLEKIQPAEAEGFEDRARLYFSQVIFTMGLMVSWLYDVYTRAEEMVTQAATMADPLSQASSLLSIGLDKAIPQDADDFEDRTRTYMMQLSFALGLMVYWLGNISTEGRRLIGLAAEAAEPLKSMTDLLGVNLAQTIPPPPNFGELFGAFLTGLMVAAAMMIPALRNLRAAYEGEVLTEVNETAGLLQGIMDLLGLGEVFTNLSKVNIGSNIEGLFVKIINGLTRATAIFVPGLQAIQNQWGAALETVKAISETIKTVIGNTSDAYKAGIEFANGQTMNLGAFKAKLAQLYQASALVTAPTPTPSSTPASGTGSAATPSGPQKVTINLIINGILSGTFTSAMDSAGNVDVELGQIQGVA